MAMANRRRKEKLFLSRPSLPDLASGTGLTTASTPINNDTTRIPIAIIVGAMASPMVTRRRKVSITPVSMSFGIQIKMVNSDPSTRKSARPIVQGAFCISQLSEKKGLSKSQPFLI